MGVSETEKGEENGFELILVIYGSIRVNLTNLNQTELTKKSEPLGEIGWIQTVVRMKTHNHSRPNLKTRTATNQNVVNLVWF